MKVRGTGSRCLLEECVKDNYYARFHPHSYHCCKEMKFIPRLEVNFLGQGACLKGVSRTISMQGFIFTATTAAEK